MLDDELSGQQPPTGTQDETISAESDEAAGTGRPTSGAAEIEPAVTDEVAGTGRPRPTRRSSRRKPAIPQFADEVAHEVAHEVAPEVGTGDLGRDLVGHLVRHLVGELGNRRLASRAPPRRSRATGAGHLVGDRRLDLGSAGRGAPSAGRLIGLGRNGLVLGSGRRLLTGKLVVEHSVDLPSRSRARATRPLRSWAGSGAEAGRSAAPEISDPATGGYHRSLATALPASGAASGASPSAAGSRSRSGASGSEI